MQYNILWYLPPNRYDITMKEVLMDSALWLKIYTNKQSVFMLENKQQTKKYDWILLDKNNY